MQDVVLRVTVDDVGLGTEVADAALDLLHAGLPVCGSVAAPGPTAIADARRLAAAGVPLGIHVVLTQERSVTGPSALTDSSGRFPRRVTGLIARWANRSFQAADAAREISAQIEMLLDSGTRLGHLDGHEHVHALPFLADVIPDLARRYGIPRIRDVGSLGFVTGRRRIARLLIRWAGRRLRSRATARGEFSAVRLWGFDVSGRLDLESLRRILEKLSPGRHELLTHPATADLSRYADWGYSWRREFESLLDLASSSRPAELGIRFDPSG